MNNEMGGPGILTMSFLPAILIGLFVLLVADATRWSIVVRRELKQRNLVRVGGLMARINPGKGFRVIEACTCLRRGKKYRVIILNRGWFDTRPFVEVDEV
jgi:hypothetical protein